MSSNPCLTIQRRNSFFISIDHFPLDPPISLKSYSISKYQIDLFYRQTHPIVYQKQIQIRTPL
ncbi:hypothetical protein BDQ12DRAFT_681698 [Crucibulum laeve]|uniref:Uncharacterized protein n=1 Tax=Crucibulum laeve TaxID=68775 RepID=A0A5C3M483_9AGAR|nr:hypothetical protein BDQ12DRAFT_681698 [Crucibulum laeve]